MTDKTLKEHVKKCGDLKSKIDELTALYNNEKTSITEELNSRCITGFNSSKYAVKLATYTRSQFDGKALKASYPSLYDEFTKHVEQSRFTVTAV